VHNLFLQVDIIYRFINLYHDGYRYLVVPKFLSSEETNSLLTRSKELLDEFNIDDHPLVTTASFIRQALELLINYDHHDRRSLQQETIIMLEMTIS
jgi:hypothetical protein